MVHVTDFDENGIRYQNNPRLKRVGAKLQLTRKQVHEYAKCAGDPVYFIERYVKIITLDDGLMPMHLYPKQKEMIELVHNNRKSIIKAARQVGKTSTIATGYLLHYLLFNSDKTIGILANKEATAMEILARIKNAYLNLPLWLQQGVEEWNKSSIILENNARILAGSTSSDAIRGWSLNCIDGDSFIDVKIDGKEHKITIKKLEKIIANSPKYTRKELDKGYAYVSREQIFKNLHESNVFGEKGEIHSLEQRIEVKTPSGYKPFGGLKITTNRQTIEISTKNHKIICTPDHRLSSKLEGWLEAQSTFEKEIWTESGWEIVEKITTHSNINVYDLVDVEKEHSFIANGILVHNCLYLDEFAFVPSHIAHDFFTSVYPTLSSGKTTKIIITSTPNGLNLFYKLCTDAVNKRNDFEIKEFDWEAVPWRDAKWAEDQKQTLGEDKFEQEHLVHFLGSAGTLIAGKYLREMSYIDPLEELFEKKLQIYQKPVPNTAYMLIADSSHGKEIDYSAFTVIDVSQTPYKIVAKFRDNNISAQLYPNVIVSAAKFYNNAIVLGENNDIGSLVLSIIVNDLEYDNVIYTDDNNSEKKMFEQTGKTVGVRTTHKVKRQGCNALKTLVENKQMIVDDFHIIEELSTFIVKPNKTYAAEDGKHDDLVMCLILFSWATTQLFFKDLTNQDMRKKIFEQRAKEIEEELPPAPIHVPGPEMRANTFREGGVIWEEVSNWNDDISEHAWSGRYTGY